MNKYYSLLGIGLLTAATLISCQEEVLVNESGKLPEEVHAFKTLAAIEAYRADDGEASSRANVQDDGRSFMWNTGDNITLWDGETGHVFSISQHYNDAEFPSAQVPFYCDEETGWTDGKKVWGIYPQKEGVSAETAFTFDLPGEQTMTFDSKPHVQQTMHMVAEGTVKGTEVEKLSFRHLTALFQFNLTNLRDVYESVTVNSVTVKSSEAVFSTKMKLNAEGQPENYASENLLAELTLRPEGGTCVLVPNQSLTTYMNVFPTLSLTGDTELTFTVNYTENNEARTEVKSGKVSELYAGLPLMTLDGGQYVAGKRYVVNLNIALSEAERGYVDMGDGSYAVHSAKGLMNLVKYEAEEIASENTVITLDGETDDAYDMGGENWTPIPVFKGTFNGNGKTVKNFTIVSQANGGFITQNLGTLKNLKLAGVTMNTVPVEGGDVDANSNGILAGRNDGMITGCEVNAATMTNNNITSNIGFLVGYNAGTIEKSKVTGNSVLTLTGQNSSPRAGGLTGYNKGLIFLSSVEEGARIDVQTHSTGAPNIGGIVGWNQNGTLTGCFAAAYIYSNQIAIKAGGLMGVCNGNIEGNAVVISACYTAGEIELYGTGHSTIGGLVGAGGDTWAKSPLKFIGCYTVTSMAKSTKPQNVGGFIGSHDVSQVALEFNACVYSNDKTGVLGGTPTYEGVTYEAEKANVAKHVEEMNSAIAETGLEYTNGSGNLPLILQTAEPGFGGSDFDEGDEL